MTVVEKPRTVRDPNHLYVIHSLDFRISGAEPTLRSALDAQLNGEVRAIERAFIARAHTLDGDRTPFTLTVALAGEDRWDWLYGVRILQHPDLHGAHPYDEVSGLALDLRTGRRLTPADVFTSVPAAHAAVRKAVQSKGWLLDPGTPVVLAERSTMDGSGGLAWYPTRTGLTVQSGTCAISGCAEGTWTLVVPWTSLPPVRAGALPR